MNHERPLVSILIPVYNRESIIAETLLSAISQTYQNIEVVVVDNASTDNTLQIIQSLAQTDSRIRYFSNEKNLGPVRNWLRCIEESKGVYGKILWSDDLISPDFLERTVPYLVDPSIGFVFSSTVIFTEDMHHGDIHYCIGKTGVYPTSKFLEGDIKSKDYPVSPGCALFRMIDLKENLLLQIENPIGSDFSMHAIGNDLLLFMLTANKYSSFAFVSEVLSYFRSHSGSISISSSNSKLPMCYNLARAYFVESYRPDLIGELNKRLFLDLKKYPDMKSYGVGTISGFYKSNKNTGFSKFGLCFTILDKVIRKIFGKFK